ncbi:hypothetical protein BT69DRAFT_1280914 [Atractiella rhizophila]|nr:hypothetical protein BT69DRAFT_1280914 [Atractiella rhizophila]
MRFLGDDYVKAEFRRHKEVTNPIQLLHFLGQWREYLDKLESSHPDQFGQLSSDDLDKFNDQQIGQLAELKEAAKDLYKEAVVQQTKVS